MSNDTPRQLGQFSVPSTRSGGRKVDTWSYFFPDRERAEINVSLFTKNDSIRFVASSPHPRLEGRTWEDTDIMRLSALVKSEVEAVTEQLAGSRWQSALLLEITPDQEVRKGRTKTSLTISSHPLLLDLQTQARNDGTRAVIRDGKPEVVRERAWSDEAHVDQGNTRIRIEADTSRSLLPDTDQTRRDIARLEAMLSHFSQSLATALSPNRADPTRIPSPDDLLRMMSSAKDHVNHKPTPPATKDADQ